MLRCILVAMCGLHLLTCVTWAAPASLSKSFFAKALRAEPRFYSEPSAIHFINPFTAFNMAAASALPPPPPMFPAHSPIFKLPLKLLSNAKPIGVFGGFAPKPLPPVDNFIPHVSNMIRLPLKYVSNAKPIGVYFNFI